MVHRGRCLVIQGLVGPLIVVEVDVLAQAEPGLSRVGIFVQVHLLVFYSSPKPLGEDVVPYPAVESGW